MSAQRKLSSTLGGLVWFGGILAVIYFTLKTSTVPERLPAASDSTIANMAARSSHQKPISSESTRSRSQQLWNYFTGNKLLFVATLPGLPLEVGDPVFYRDTTGSWHEVGFVFSCDNPLRATRAEIVWYASPDGEDSTNPSEYSRDSLSQKTWRYHENRGDFQEVLQTMFPPEQRSRLEQLIRSALDAHSEEITTAMTPIVTATMRESIPVIQQSLTASIHVHRSEIEALGKRYEQSILQETLVPLLREDIFPIVKRHGQPVAELIGKELWDRASFWRFGWRALYDRTPLPERDLLRGEWDRFVTQEAIPIIESYTPEIIEAQRRILIDISKNENVRRELREIANELIDDEDLRKILTAMLREAILENQALREVWSNQWETDEAKAAIQIASDRLAPLIRQIGDEVFGTQETGINPSFARVLRNQVLGKDRRWLSVETPLNSLISMPVRDEITILPSDQWEPYPLVIMAGNGP